MTDIPKNTPFRIAKRFPTKDGSLGNLKDWTIFIIDELNVIRIFFRHEDMFLNPPDNRMYNRIARDIEKYGPSYVAKAEFEFERKQAGNTKPLKKELNFYA